MKREEEFLKVLQRIAASLERLDTNGIFVHLQHDAHQID